MESPVYRCEACGALLPEGSLQCTYCQAVVSTVPCAHCFELVNTHAQFCHHCGKPMASTKAETHAMDLSCPQCRIPMKAQLVGESEIAQCAKCGGIWVDHERFRELSAQRVETGKAAFAAGAKPHVEALSADSIRYRPCPLCHQFMNRINFGKHSGVILDACKSHGLWFDRDELRHVMKFIESGGLAHTEQVQTEAHHEAERALARIRIEAEMTEPKPSHGDLELGDVVDVIGRLGRFLLH